MANHSSKTLEHFSTAHIVVLIFVMQNFSWDLPVLWNVSVFGFSSHLYGGWLCPVVLSGCTCTKSLPVPCPHINAFFLNFPQLFLLMIVMIWMAKQVVPVTRILMVADLGLIMLKKDSRSSLLVALWSLICGAMGRCLLGLYVGQRLSLKFWNNSPNGLLHFPVGELRCWSVRNSL